MKKMYKILSFFLVFIILLSFSSCGKDYSDAIIYFELSEKPSTVDPQLASSDSELMIVRNIYEGLLRKNESGATVCGVAESYEKNGLTYTFHLRKDACWNCDKPTPLTADDFVFAFRRAVDPKTKSPFVNRLFCIANAEDIYNGKSDISSLGVSSTGDNTLVITLCREQTDFENTLTTSICMPCNEKFFNECIGKYGLENEYCISNGSYALTKWNKEDFGIRLRKNQTYKGGFVAKNSAVFFSLCEDEIPIDRLKKDTADIAFIDNSQLQDAKSGGLNVCSFENICWFLSINNTCDKNIRKAFMMLVSSDVYGDSLPDGFKVANSAFPSVINVDDGVLNVGIEPYDILKSKEIFSSAVTQFDNKIFPSETLYFYDDAGIKDCITAIAGHWQQNLSAFINISSSDDYGKFSSQFESQTLPFSVFPVKATSSSAEEYIYSFGKTFKDNNPVDFQKKLCENHLFVPIAFENTNIAFTKSIETVYPEFENGYIDFSMILKKEQ